MASAAEPGRSVDCCQGKGSQHGGSVLARRLRMLRDFTFVWTPWRLNLVNALLAPVPYHFVAPVRSRLYRWAGLRGIHPTVFIEGPILLRARPHAYKHLRIGPGSEVFGPCSIETGADVTIGANVGICIGTTIFTSSHEIGGEERRMGPLAPRPVRIEDGAWIGGKSVITGGVTVGKGAVVGPGSVVVKDVPPNTLVQGAPARVVGWLDGKPNAGADTADDADRPNGATPRLSRGRLRAAQ